MLFLFFKNSSQEEKWPQEVLLNGKLYIYTLGLTNLHLGFRVKVWGFEDRVSNYKF